jgi:hypothetical protein
MVHTPITEPIAMILRRPEFDHGDIQLYAFAHLAQGSLSSPVRSEP